MEVSKSSPEIWHPNTEIGKKIFECLTNIPARAHSFSCTIQPPDPLLSIQEIHCAKEKNLPVSVHGLPSTLPPCLWDVLNYKLKHPRDWCLYFPNRDLAKSSGLHCLFLGLLHSAHSRIIFFFNLKISQNCLLGKHLKLSNSSPRWLQTLMVCCTNNGLSSICRS